MKVFVDKKFKVLLSKIKDNLLKHRVRKQIKKIKANPKVGKPVRYARKGTRELQIRPFELSYAYDPEQDKIYILPLYHRKHQ